jgi:transketolase
MTLFRPGDANEVVEAYRYVMQLRHRPALMVLSRQTPADARSQPLCAGVRRGKGSVRARDAPDGKPEVILVATAAR